MLKIDWVSPELSQLEVLIIHNILPSPGRISNSSSSDLKMSTSSVRTAMTTANWLRAVISPATAEPSSALRRFLSSCDRDVTHEVVSRAHIIVESLFPKDSLQSATLMDDVWAEQRTEALKLYYMVLESVCNAEANILHTNNLTSLLINERFHRCMLACSAELIVAAHKAVIMLIPGIFERIGITAFDLCKVIESFIRHAKMLPRELCRHLNSLEARLLESFVWRKGSSMYNSLIVSRPALIDEINRQGLLAEPMPSLDSIVLEMNCRGLARARSVRYFGALPGQSRDFQSPKTVCSCHHFVPVEQNCSTPDDHSLAFNDIKPKPPSLLSAFSSPAQNFNGGGVETCADTDISLFCSKIVRVAAIHINDIVERLQLSQQIRESVYLLFQQILSRQMTLLFDCHIDKIIFCCFYGVAKLATHTNLTFREILWKNRKQRQYDQDTCINMPFDLSNSTELQNERTEELANITTFYNRRFVPVVKPLLDLLGLTETSKGNQVPGIENYNYGHSSKSSKISTFPKLPNLTPRKVSARLNIYVSPIRSSKMVPLVSPGSKSYYACVGESTRAFQSPSKDLASINLRLKSSSTQKCRRKLNLDNNAALVSDSVVAQYLK